MRGRPIPWHKDYHAELPAAATLASRNWSDNTLDGGLHLVGDDEVQRHYQGSWAYHIMLSYTTMDE